MLLLFCFKLFHVLKTEHLTQCSYFFFVKRQEGCLIESVIRWLEREGGRVRGGGGGGGGGGMGHNGWGNSNNNM